MAKTGQETSIESLIADYCAWSEVLESFEGQALNEWQPYVKAHQANIRHQIARIGGKKALAQLRMMSMKRVQDDWEKQSSKSNSSNLII